MEAPRSVDARAAEPAEALSSDALSSSAASDADPTLSPASHPSSAFLASEPPEPAPVPETEDWSPAVESATPFDDPATNRTPAVPAPLDLEEAQLSEAPGTELAEIPAVGETFFAAEPAPPSPVLSAWGPPPPAWPPVATSAPTAEGIAPGSTLPLDAAPSPVPAVQPVSEEPHVETGPNWMLAFVCLWAAGTALNESWFLAMQVGLTPALLRNVTVMGYGVLGLGLVGFALDALSSGKKQSPAASIIKALIPALLTLAGVILLVLSNDPGRRI